MRRRNLSSLSFSSMMTPQNFWLSQRENRHLRPRGSPWRFDMSSTETQMRLSRFWSASNRRPDQTRCLMLDIPSIAQRPDIAKRSAERILARLPEHDPPSLWRFEVWEAQYVAGFMDEDELNPAVLDRFIWKVPQYTGSWA